ncbi:MAG: hypothetical protein KGL70_05660, partial [Betaproteobacteria bacterium]|nr:hypothetical protein [Betaproteobacteria bacterium]
GQSCNNLSAVIGVSAEIGVSEIGVRAVIIRSSAGPSADLRTNYYRSDPNFADPNFGADANYGGQIITALTPISPSSDPNFADPNFGADANYGGQIITALTPIT